LIHLIFSSQGLKDALNIVTATDSMIFFYDETYVQDLPCAYSFFKEDESLVQLLLLNETKTISWY
jgi:hypothetical protein